MEPYKKEETIAIEAVRQAGVLASSLQSTIVRNADFKEKDDFSPVTAADFGCQALVCKLLTENFPGTVIIGEEGSQALVEDHSLRDVVVENVRRVLAESVDPETVLTWIDAASSRDYADRFWTVDPIDGTAGFLRGQQYAVALALIIKGEVTVSALACPNLGNDSNNGVIAWAVRGHGAWVRSVQHNGEFVGEPRRIRVSEDDFSKIRFCESVEPSHSNQEWAAEVAKRLGIVQAPLRVDSQVKYALIAQGEAGVYLRLPQKSYVEHIWDHAAGLLIVEEAGGHVSDAFGKSLDFRHGSDLVKNRGVIVTGLSEEMHSRVISVIQSVGFE